MSLVKSDMPVITIATRPTGKTAPETKAFLGELQRFLRFLMPRFSAEGRSRLVVAIGCTGGRHRSVVLAESVKDTLQALKYDIKIDHRDIYK